MYIAHEEAGLIKGTEEYETKQRETTYQAVRAEIYWMRREKRDDRKNRDYS